MKLNEQICNRITNEIIEIIETDKNLEWKKSWTIAGNPRNFATGKIYKGSNIFMCAIHNRKYKLKSPYFATFNQIKKAGGMVKKGSRGCDIIHFNYVKKCAICRENKENCKCSKEEIQQFKSEGKRTEYTLPLMKFWKVFNLEQTTLPLPKDKKKSNREIKKAQETIESYTKELKELNFGGFEAYYIPRDDIVNVPNRDDFKSSNHFYSVLYHELIHSTGHKDRVDRELKGRYDNSSYSEEEIVAELGSALLCGYVGIENKEVIKNSSAYIDYWLKKLREDNKFILKVMGNSQKAVDYILSKNGVAK